MSSFGLAAAIAGSATFMPPQDTRHKHLLIAVAMVLAAAIGVFAFVKHNSAASAQSN
jgi:hypothetical protein